MRDEHVGDPSVEEDEALVDAAEEALHDEAVDIVCAALCAWGGGGADERDLECAVPAAMSAGWRRCRDGKRHPDVWLAFQ